MATVCIGCGMATDAQGRLTLDVAPWPMSCEPGASPYAEPVGCGVDGQVWIHHQAVVEDYFSGLASLEYVAPGLGVDADGFTRDFTLSYSNPDPCRWLRGILLIDIDVRVDVDPNSQVFVEGISGNDAWTMRNDSTATRRLYNEFTRTIAVSIPPAGTQNFQWNVATGMMQGTGLIRSVSNVVRVFAVSSDPA